MAAVDERLVSPEDGMLQALKTVDEVLRQVQGPHPADYTLAGASIAQAQATVVLVHAVRELTAEVRKSRDAG